MPGPHIFLMHENIHIYMCLNVLLLWRYAMAMKMLIKAFNNWSWLAFRGSIRYGGNHGSMQAEWWRRSWESCICMGRQQEDRDMGGPGLNIWNPKASPPSPWDTLLHRATPSNPSQVAPLPDGQAFKSVSQQGPFLLKSPQCTEVERTAFGYHLQEQHIHLLWGRISPWPEARCLGCPVSLVTASLALGS